MVRDRTLGCPGRGDALSVVFLQDAHLELGEPAPIHVVSRADTPQLRAIVRTRRVCEGRLRYLSSGAYGGLAHIDDVFAAVASQDVAAASQQNDLVVPVACAPPACEACFAGGGRGALIRKGDDQMVVVTVSLHLGVEIREAQWIVGGGVEQARGQ